MCKLKDEREQDPIAGDLLEIKRKVKQYQVTWNIKKKTKHTYDTSNN